MNRAVPASLTFHFVVLSLLLIFGARVDQTHILPHRQISVKIVHFPKPKASEPVVQQPAVEPEAFPEITPDIPEPKDESPLPVPEETKVADANPPIVSEPVEPEVPTVDTPKKISADPGNRLPETPVTPEDPMVSEKALEIPAETPQELLSDETAIASTDQIVPSQFQYYLTLLEGRVSRHWNPKILGFRTGSKRVCIVHFYVEKEGMIVGESVLKSSGVPLFDREALKAIKAVGRFLALPPGLDSAALGVTYVFTLKSRE